VCIHVPGSPQIAADLTHRQMAMEVCQQKGRRVDCDEKGLEFANRSKRHGFNKHVSVAVGEKE